MNLDTPEGMKAAIAWTNNQMSLLKLNGLWVIPRTGTMVRKTGKRTCTVRGDDESTERVLKAAGWVITKL
jgi:hypothetical protein